MSSECEIDHLSINTFYKFSMLAVGDIGRGLSTRTLIIKTYESCKIYTKILHAVQWTFTFEHKPTIYILGIKFIQIH